MTRDDLVAALDSLLEQAVSASMPQVLLTSKAAAAAAQLAALVEPDRGDVQAALRLGVFHWLRYQRLPEGSGEEDFHAAVGWFARVLPWAPDAIPSVLLTVLSEGAPPAGDDARAWLDEAVRLLESAAGGRIPVLDRAAALLRRAVAVASADGPDRAAILFQLCRALRRLFEQVGDLANLDQAITAGREAVRLTPLAHPGRAARLSNLGAALLTRFERTGDETDLAEAITVLGEAVGTTPAGRDRASYLTNLGAAFTARFERSGVETDLDKAIAANRGAVAATPSGDSHRAGRLSNLSAALQTRFGQTGNLSDIELAIVAGREAAETIRRDDPVRAKTLAGLANALHARFRRVGNTVDLDEAITIGQKAVDTAAADDPNQAHYRSDLGTAFRTRFERNGDMVDLDWAIAVLREAVARSPVDDPHRIGSLSNFSITLMTRFDRTGSRADLDEAVALAQQVVDCTDHNHVNRPGYLSNLGTALLGRFERMGSPSDASRAIAVLDEAAVEIPLQHPSRPALLSNLGEALHSRFRRIGDPDDLDRAIAARRGAVLTTPLDHPSRSAILANLGGVLIARFRRGGNFADLEEATAQFRAGLGITSAAPTARVRCGAALGRLLAGRDWGGAQEAWDTVLSLQPLVLDRSLSRDDRQHLLHEFTDLGTSAAATRLALNDLPGAWEVLEAGRGMMLGQALETRPDPDLRRAFPDLADRLDRLCRDLNLDTTVGTQPPDTGLTPRGAAEVRRRAAGEWPLLIDEIRSKPGFDRFGSPATIDDLRRSVEHGVLVAVNVSPWRCDALILTPDGAGHLPLPGLTRDDARARADQFLKAIKHSSSKSNRIVSGVLAWLWDTVADPILEHLGYTHTPAGQWPRVWWSPTGPLTALPLHAAGRRDGAAQQAVIDRVVSSYTPTAQMLTRARRAAHGQFGDEGGLVVGIDNAPGYPRLASAAREARAVRQQHGARAALLVESDATVAAVRAGLGRWAHLACHGASMPDPADSHLVLWDGALSAREITNLDLPDAYLAYLSACTTAFGGTDLPDEAIHLASAFQLAGFAHVVATLWPISDRYAPGLADDFYRHLAGGQEPAQAVHEAVRTLRGKEPEAPLVWAPFIHFGP